MSTTAIPVTDPVLAGLRVAVGGRLSGMSKRDAHQLIRQHGGEPVELSESIAPQLIVVGEDLIQAADTGVSELFAESIRERIETGEIEVLAESLFWQQLGLVDDEHDARRLYTPAMLADLVGVPVAVVRRWHRRGLIQPAREVRRLAYFDFQEVATARRLAELLAAGVSPKALERKLAELARYVPGVDRPLTQLAIIVRGSRLLLRQGEGLVAPGGQLFFDFDALESSAGHSASASIDRSTINLGGVLRYDESPIPPEELLLLAADLEDEGELAAALEAYRAAAAAAGSSAPVCFAMAELLYRLGDLTAARERYYLAIELDENYIEARANLGCVLAELGERELAAAAFEGALSLHPDYADVHFHLARTLDDMARADLASRHWADFLRLAPESPWAATARQRLRLPPGE